MDGRVNDSRPLVSICCLAYNHAPYIRQCLDGLLAQQADFPFEVLVHDDASHDDTPRIIAEYETQYPEIIKPIYQKENQYSKGIKINQFYQYPRAQGKYIAICEGDDYWTDPRKLQKQVDFLEAHPEYGMSYTKTRFFYQQAGRFAPRDWGGPSEAFDALIWGINTIPTATVTMRRELVEEYMRVVKPEEKGWKMGDYPMWLWFAARSRIRFMDETTAVYRVLNESACHFSSAEAAEAFIRSVFGVKRFFLDYAAAGWDVVALDDRLHYELARNSILYGCPHQACEYLERISNPSVRLRLLHFCAGHKLTYALLLKMLPFVRRARRLI